MKTSKFVLSSRNPVGKKVEDLCSKRGSVLHVLTISDLIHCTPKWGKGGCYGLNCVSKEVC